MVRAIKEILKAAYHRMFPRPGVESFKKAVRKLKSGDVVIDCGANVGDFTLILAETGAFVHAFEPDSVAREVLLSRTAGLENVLVHNAAVSSRSGTAKLYFHEQRASNPVEKSTGSSLVESKTNVNEDTFEEVPLVRLADFIRQIGRVRLMKMDIEGHEIEVLNDIFDERLEEMIDIAFVELHDRKNPQLVGATNQLRERIKASGRRFDLSWH